MTKCNKSNIILVLAGQTRKAICEESPSTAEQSRLITSSRGDSRKSATERYRRKVRVKKWGKSPLEILVTIIRCKLREVQGVEHMGCSSVPVTA